MNLKALVSPAPSITTSITFVAISIHICHFSIKLFNTWQLSTHTLPFSPIYFHLENPSQPLSRQQPWSFPPSFSLPCLRSRPALKRLQFAKWNCGELTQPNPAIPRGLVLVVLPDLLSSSAVILFSFTPRLRMTVRLLPSWKARLAGARILSGVVSKKSKRELFSSKKYLWRKQQEVTPQVWTCLLSCRWPRYLLERLR